MSSRLPSVLLNCKKESLEQTNKAAQPLMTNNVNIFIIKVMQHPWISVGPNRIVTTKNQVAQVLVGVASPHLGHHEKEHFFWMELEIFATSRGYLNEAIVPKCCNLK